MASTMTCPCGQGGDVFHWCTAAERNAGRREREMAAQLAEMESRGIPAWTVQPVSRER